MIGASDLPAKEGRMCFRNVRLSAVGGALCMLLLVCACKSTRITTRYKPLHPANSASIEFKVSASDQDGIKRAELFVYEHNLSVVSGMQTATQRSGGTWGLVKTWNYAGNPGSITETHSVSGFPANTWIRYIMLVTDKGNNSKTESWSFAAGDWPFGNSPIPLWGNGAPADRIDICFVADNTDYTTARGMLGDLEPLIFDGYHTNNGIKSGRKFWQFYYSPQRGFISDFDTPPLQMDIPNSVMNSGIIDGAAVIHTTVKRDWAQSGNFGTEPTNIGTAAHESAHAIYGLSDEYNGGGHSTSADPHHNNYNSQGAAQTYNTNNGWPTSDVQNIQGSWWRPEPSSLDCIMFNDGDATMPDFERTCFNRIIWFHNQLAP